MTPALIVSGMTDPDVQDETLSRFEDHQQQSDGASDPSHLDVISDPESNTVTFVSKRAEDDTTTAWITADVDVLVDLSETQ